MAYDPTASALESLAAKGAIRASSARGVADRADVVFASLPTPGVVREVALGPDGVLRGQRARCFVDFSTTGPRVAGEVAASFAEAGRTTLDAPVSGGVTGAEAGRLAIMVSGPVRSTRPSSRSSASSASPSSAATSRGRRRC